MERQNKIENLRFTGRRIQASESPVYGGTVASVNPPCCVPKFIFRKLKPIIPMQWVPVTTAWRVLGLRIEERSPIRRVAANKFYKQSRTADEGWSTSFGVGRGANNPSL